MWILGVQFKANDKKSKRNLKRQISRLLKEKAFNDKDIVTLTMSNRVRTVLDFVFKITLHFLESKSILWFLNMTYYISKQMAIIQIKFNCLGKSVGTDSVVRTPRFHFWRNIHKKIAFQMPAEDIFLWEFL